MSVFAKKEQLWQVHKLSTIGPFDTFLAFRHIYGEKLWKTLAISALILC